MTDIVETASEPLTTQRFVERTIGRLQAQYLAPAPTSWARATLAQLRRSVGQPLGSDPEILALVVNPDAPATAGPATADELAIAAALGLYAVHQQSAPTPMHVTGTSFGAALGRIARRGGEEVPGVTRRFHAAGTAQDWGELQHHVRGLVALLRSERQGFHYGWFAQDLVDFQRPERRDAVTLRWGRAFYRVTSTEPASTEPTSTQN